MLRLTSAKPPSRLMRWIIVIVIPCIEAAVRRL